MSGLTREAIVKALHDKGAYCGVCDYETALDGTPGCSECRQVLEGYAEAILALTPTADRDTIVEALAKAAHQQCVDAGIPERHMGQLRELAQPHADAVLAVLADQPTVAQVKAAALRDELAVLRRAATIYAGHGLIGRAESIAQFADRIEAGGRP